MKKTLLAVSLLTFGLSGCVSDELMGAVGKTYSGLTVTSADIQAQASLSAKQMDSDHEIAPPNNKYSKRLKKLTQGLVFADATPLNFQVYLSDEINAFAMPDGTIRVYSGLMDVMKDDELVAVIGHEIGHIKHEHSLNQFKKAAMASGLTDLAKSVGGKTAELASSEYAEMGNQFLNAQFSQKDELQADEYGIEILCKQKMDPYAAMRAQEVLMRQSGNGGGLFSSHPSSAERIEKARNAAAAANCNS